MKKSRFLIVSIALILSVLMVASVCIFASADQTAKLTVDASGGKVKVLVNDELKSHGTSTAALKVAIGSKVTLVVEDNTEGFLFWTDSALNTCGNGAATYTFTMTGDASYTAWFKSADGTLVVYRNTNDSKQVLASAEYSSSAEFKAHLVDSAIKFGYTFSKWNMTEAEIVAAIDAKTPVVEVAPVYTDKVASYTIKVNNGAIQEASATTGSYAYGTEITLVAGTAPTGYSFSAWKNSAGKVISTSSTLKVKVFTNETFSAVYTEAPVTYPASAELSITSDKANKTLVSTATFFIPEGNVTEYGLIYSKNVKCDATSLMLGNVDGQGIKKASYKGYTNVLANYFSGVDSVSARSYIIYTDSTGTHTLYSDVVYAEYDDTILKLNIADAVADATNASASGYAIKYNPQSRGSVSVVKDEKLDRDVMEFVSGGAWQVTTAYSMPVDSSVNEDLANGFSYEAFFKPTKKATGNYTAVLDYEEGGGFGLELLPSGNDNTVIISAELHMNSSGYVKLQKTVELNDWYHVVYTYNGTNTISLYINGKLEASQTVSGYMTTASFTYNDPHICIGACTTTGENKDWCGFDGRLAVCNMFSTPITDATQVSDMYVKAKTVTSDAPVSGGVSAPTQSEQEIINELLNLKHELRVDANGDFKVVVFSDFQCSTISVTDTKVHTDAKYPNYGKTYGETLVESMNNIKLIVDREDPDLVLFAGDNSWNIRSEADMKTAISNMVSYIESKQIPWAHVFGNHDDEHTTRNPDILTKEEQQKVYESFAYCISKDVKYGYDGEELFGVGNYVLPVLTNDGSKIAFNIWALDSGQYDHAFNEATDNIVFDGNGFYGHYQSMEKNQVDWYYETSKLLEKYNGGETIPAMLYQHIPLQESYFAYKYGTDKTGTKGENISAHPENVGLFSAIKDRGDIQLIAHGHDHKNDFSAVYNGITFAYTASIGTEEYYDASMLGGRVVTFSTKTGKVETEMSYINTKSEVGDILELKINDDNSVSNAVSGRPVLNSYTGTSGTKSVTTDATLNRKFIHFTGGTANNAPSTYWMSMADFDSSLISDGIAVEALFRATDTPVSTTDANGNPKKTYVGIIDYAEGGGFALNYYSDGNLTFDLGDSSTAGYATLAAPIEENVWYHVVCDYNASTGKITMYLNGVQVDQKSVTTGYRAPGSFWGTPGAYMCVGGLAQSNCYGAGGFMGDIAIANVYVNPKTSEEAIMMYNSVKASSFKNDGTMLKLNITDDAVTNASATGPLLLKYNSTNNTTTVGTDAVLNRKVITFNGGTYRLYPETLEADFANGFAYEVLFKATSSETYESNTKYAGVLDFDESNGGFGLRYIRKDENTITLQFTFATSDSDTIKNVAIGDVSVGEWCHVVFSFDGTNINVWVNGTNVYSQAAGGSFRTANFAKGCGFIAIGAAAWDDSKTAGRDYGIYGLRGSIAICNIYSDGVNAAKAAELYAATGLK